MVSKYVEILDFDGGWISQVSNSNRKGFCLVYKAQLITINENR